jgi:alkylation response protein AidB-like acyl-CoA dehydrogenase
MEAVIDQAEHLFRQEVRDWLANNVPTSPRPMHGSEALAFDVEWQRKQYDSGWAGIAWPKAYGGRGLSLTEQLIWYEEYAKAGGPSAGYFFVALSHGGPTLIERGSTEQKAFHLPRILKGEAVWCQGFSEPGSGSDLASLRTRGVISGDHLVVSGQKIWTSYADKAHYQELLVRTDPNSSRHAGLTWIICDMGLPGITVRPLQSMSGEYHCNEVFYDEVAIPLENVVGEINDGWSVAMATLGLERGTSLIARQIELAKTVDLLLDAAKSICGDDGRPVISNDEVYHRIAVLRAEVLALKAMAYAVVSRARQQSIPGPEGSIIALYYGELSQRVVKTAVEILGPAVIELSRPGGWTFEYLNAFKNTIAGGTSQIRRNIIGERLLGLPREAKR